jgi:hypothetical protein
MRDVWVFLPAALAVSANAIPSGAPGPSVRERRVPIRSGGPRHGRGATAGWPLPVRIESTRLAGGGR